jgi:hypothetical protein
MEDDITDIANLLQHDKVEVFYLLFCMCIKLGLSYYRKRAFENRVLRRIFGPKRVQVAGGWRRLHNEELHDMYTSQNIRMIKLKRVK